MVIYTVRRGDSVYSIAKKYGLPMQKIIDDNQLEYPRQLVIGQAIVVDTDSVSHTVSPGESLYLISRSYGVRVSDLLAANPQITNPSLIHPGQTVTIPVSGGNLGPMDVNGYAFPNIGAETLNLTLPHLTYITLFSYQINADGSLNPIVTGTVVSRARESGVAPLMAITNIRQGGGFDSDLAHEVLSSETAQENLLDQVVQTLESGYEGLNIDFEYIFRTDRENYNQFLRRATERLHPLGYIVTTSLAPKQSADQAGLLYEAHDYPAHGELADLVILMTYEWGYTYGPPQAVAPLDQVEKVLQYAVSVLPSQKILMGIPNYGYDWTLPFVQGTSARSLSNTAAVSLAVRTGSEIRFDQAAQSPFFEYFSGGRQHVVWFEDARSIDSKLRLAARYGLGGVSYWTINRFFSQNFLVLQSLVQVRKVMGT